MLSTTPDARPTAKEPIPIRRIDFKLDPSSLPRDYYAGDPQLTLVLNALSAFFPDGERFFVDAVRHYKDRITDPELLADVAGFSGQEAMHAAQHEAFNALVEAQGLPRSTKLGEKIASVLLDRGRKLPMSVQLAATCGLEHFTAMLAEQILSRPGHSEKFVGAARELWLWHALEESEHKTVAFDVYETVNGSRALLGVVMVPVSALLLGATAITWVAMVAERGELFEFRRHLHTLNYLWGRKGIFTELVPQYFEYFRPDFHPSRSNADAAVAKTRELLFGENGLLREKLRQVRLPKRPERGRA